MAEDDGDKTEAATPKRRQQAEEQGQIAKSQDLVAAALIVGAMYLLGKFGKEMWSSLRLFMIESLASVSAPPSEKGAVEQLGRGIFLSGMSSWPLLVGLMVIGIVGNVGQIGLKFNVERIQPNLAALNPFKGFSRMFTGGNPMKFAMSLAKLGVIAYVGWGAVTDRLAEIVMSQRLEIEPLFSLAVSTIYAVAMKIGMSLLVLAVIDYVWQRWKYERDLRMTKQEVKDEMRSMEGDPKIKGRRRQVAMQIAGRKLKGVVPTADVVVTNPTEYAVALKYDASGMHAPTVIAKGQGLIAAKIRQLAIEAGVPILERKPLARALYKLVPVGQEIPEQFYSAVAEILAYVYELTGKAKRKVMA